MFLTGFPGGINEENVSLVQREQYDASNTFWSFVLVSVNKSSVTAVVI